MEKLEKLYGVYKGTGKRALVLGLGISTKDLDVNVLNENIVTFGVNDVGGKMVPDYLVIMDKKESFTQERKDTILSTGAGIASLIYDESWLKLDKTGVFRDAYKLNYRGTRGQLNLMEDKNLVNIGYDSPWITIGICYKLGFKDIGLIGVDFTQNHYNRNDGLHSLNKQLHSINEMYGTLCSYLKNKGVNLYNLSPVSRLNKIPKISIGEFLGPQKA